jgi:DEAD/DEAH box helicase domain-containing protein
MDIGEWTALYPLVIRVRLHPFINGWDGAGRNQQDSSFYLVGSQNPVDQYLMKHPEFIQDSPIEPALIDPYNLLILFQHLQCSLLNFHFPKENHSGNLSIEATRIFWIISYPPESQEKAADNISGFNRIFHKKLSLCEIAVWIR